MSAGTVPDLFGVVAMTPDRVIGKDGGMPWTMPGDLKRYRRLTMGRPMIMGRRTLDSIGKCLPGRDTIVLTRSASLPYEGAVLAGDVETALDRACAAARQRETDAIAVVGGEAIFRAFMPRLARLYVTIVEQTGEGDTHFPPIDPAEWRLESEEPCERDPRDSAPSRFLTYRRIS